MMFSSHTRRILVIDDDAQMLDSYRRVLSDLVEADQNPKTELSNLSSELFGETIDTFSNAGAVLEDVVYCRQGLQGVQAAQEAFTSGRPFAVAFIDMRMPPGIDGLETARLIRALDPHVNIVIVTGYSDHKPAAITAAVGRPEKLFYLLKPFDGSELQTMASALANRWSCDMETAAVLAKRVAELERANAALLASEARAQEAARCDALTGLSNRMGLSEHFQRATHTAQADGRRLSVLYLDLDHFKDVNDSLGHAVGDALIREFARRVQQTTSEDGFVARLGGDEFAVICSDGAKAFNLSQRLLETGKSPYVIDGHVIHTSFSIGIASCESGKPNLIEAMRRADIALYAAKAAGRGVSREFEPSMERAILNAQDLTHDLIRAISDDGLLLHYQPVVHADDVSIFSVEALLRWPHPTRGMIPPLEFISVAEKSDAIHELGNWVIRRAFTDSRLWPDLITSINLSPAQLRVAGFAENLKALACETSVDPKMIEFEITETVLLDDIARAADQLRALRSMGFRIALDDFGSGYAGIAYLKQLKFDRLKIDRSFVRDLASSPGASGVLTSIVALAQAMGLAITAEGVENREQHQFLKSVGCSEMQGFLFHRPLSREDLLMLRRMPPLLQSA